MTMKYRPIDPGWVRDPVMRALVDDINRTLGDWSAQFSTATAASDSPGTGTHVNSIQANSDPKFSGAIRFNNTPTITVNSAVHNFTWTVNTVGVVAALSGVPAVAYDNAAVEGVANSFIRTDATLDITGLTTTPTTTWGTAFAEGVLAKFIRTDATLQYPPALGVTASPITDMLTLTDDGTEGALLTASNTFSVNGAAIKAPNATNTLRIGKYGNVSVAGSALVDQTLCSFSKTDYNEAAAAPTAVVCQITNTNTGTATGAARGLAITANATMANAAGASTNPLIGSSMTLAAGNTSNNFFTGSLFGYRFGTLTATAQTIGTAIPAITMFEAGSVASPYTLTRVAVTDIMAFRARGGATLLTSAAVTNFTGFRCDAITAGTNRYGMDIAAITGGTLAYGIQIATHSGGTTRRAVIGGNTFESTANDFLCSTAVKGLICKDAQGTAEYWRVYASVSGTTVKDATWTTDADGFASFTRAASATGSVILNVQDTGTTAPAA